MSITKNALIRYHTLDRCFANPGRRYSVEDLLEECNNALKGLDVKSEGIKKRQLYDDIRFMQSEQGWSIDLEKSKSGRNVFYRYADSSFSIKNQPVNEMEANQLKSAIQVLSRFKGMPQFSWIEELIPKLDQSFSLSSSPDNIISFDTNEYLRGIEFLSELFNAIVYKKTLRISYKSFKTNEPVEIIFHPYHLKQYNRRWFLFGKNSEYDNITNLALDRIQSIEESSDKYIENTDINFDEYFEDIIGVTLPTDKEVQKIELLAKESLAPYIITKPIHESQSPLKEYEEGFKFFIKVIPNRELESVILGFGEDLKVVAPEEFKIKIANRIRENLENYD
ncbi:helix-turn-helix transcriptional regulator [Gelidibacter japonicus]|uniref:helix-turn-helix transcriptional regulator n=1 Tax=Gelidibacter japonicus TaxID=1962232 RepID=UPI003A937E81